MTHQKSSDHDWRDPSGKRLADYPHPSLAVDTALLTVRPEADSWRLAVLQVRLDSPRGRASWALPGTFVHPGETLADAVRRCLRTKAKVTGQSPSQLHLFDRPDRDPRGWVVSAAHFDVARWDQIAPMLDPSRTRLADASRPGRLPYDHSEIVARAVTQIRAEYAQVPDPRGLLPEQFTIRQLRQLHEVVAGIPLQADTFRRQMLPHLVKASGNTRGKRGRPAQLYQVRQDH
jgi:ADP-ribose pyrophosphatase YjhB (NUDIX family)